MIPQTALPTRFQEPAISEGGDHGIRIHRPMATAIPQPPAAGGLKPFAYLKYRWVTVLFLGGLLAATLAFAAYSVIPSKYTTYSLVRIFSADPVLHSTENREGRGDFTIYLKSQSAMIKSNFVLTAALRDPNVAALPMLRDQADPVRFLEEELKIETQEGSEILKLSLSGDDAKGISMIVNSIQDSYFREVVDEEVKRKKTRLQHLEDAILKMQLDVSRRQENVKQADVGGNGGVEAITGLNASLAASQLVHQKETIAKIENDISNWQLEKKSLEKKLTSVADEVPAPPPNYFDTMENDTRMVLLKKKIEGLTARVDYLIKLSNDPKLASVVDMRQKITEANEERERFRKERIAEFQKGQTPHGREKVEERSRTRDEHHCAVNSTKDQRRAGG